jgi:hypothetical protein
MGAVLSAASVGVALCLTSANVASAADCRGSVRGDVNGDGHAEVVIGEPGHGGDRGAVHVLYGRTSGLVVNAAGTARDDQYFTQNTAGVPGAAEANDQFGTSAIFGDFNDDGCADLAVGAPGENIFTGLVVVLYGSPTGLVTSGAQSFTIAGLFGPGQSSESQRFGSSFAVGDLDDDGVDDLAIGAPEKPFRDAVAAGAAVVLFGDSRGLNRGTTPATLLTQNTPDVPGFPEEFDMFGASLAIGDFDGDGVAELAVGVPGENDQAGAVQTLEGGSGGFGPIQARTVTQNVAGLPGGSEALDGFGFAVAAGDVTGDGRADLAVGAPGENPVGTQPFIGQGEVDLLLGSATGLTGTGSQRWTQASRGVVGAVGARDQFGFSLVMARLDNGPRPDLAIGTPGDGIGSTARAGSVTILLGGATGLTTAEAGGQLFHQNVSGISGAAETGDGFGTSVAAPLIQTPDQGSLVIGVPFEKVGADSAGMVHQLSTFEFGPNPIGSRTFHLDTPGLRGAPADGDLFGYSVR